MSQKCQQSQGSGGVVVTKRRTVVNFGLDSRFRVSKVSIVIGIGGVVVAKRRTVVIFGLVWRLLVSKVSTVTGIGGGSWSRNAELSSLLDSFRVFASQKCQQSPGSWGGRRHETQNCRQFWTRLASPCLKSVNSHQDRGGSSSRKAELSSILDSPLERGKERGERRKVR